MNRLWWAALFAGAVVPQPSAAAPPSVSPPASPPHASHQPQDSHYSSGNGATVPAPSSTQAKLVLPLQATPALNARHPVQGQQPTAGKKMAVAPAPNTRSGPPVWIFLLMLVVLLVVIALLLVFLTHHGHRSAVSGASIGAFYERNAAFSIVTATALAPAWLWACCAGITATAGLSW